jgi:hypothetical protein
MDTWNEQFLLFAADLADSFQPYPRTSDAARVIARWKRYGNETTISAFKRAVIELSQEGAIRLCPAQPRPIEVTPAFRAEVARMSSGDLLKRLNRDSEFRSKFDQLAIDDAAGKAQATPITLSAEDYRRMPMDVVQRRYKSDVAFKAAVDALHGSGAA